MESFELCGGERRLMKNEEPRIPTEVLPVRPSLVLSIAVVVCGFLVNASRVHVAEPPPPADKDGPKLFARAKAAGRN